jgi:hypothetical protein
MRSRRARLLRLAYALTNVVAALTSLFVGALLLLTREAPPPPPRALAYTLPEGAPAGFDTSRGPLHAPRILPTPAKPSAYEDLQILIDAPAEFEQRYRVIFALLEREPAERRCIIERRGPAGVEGQIVLSPNDRMGTWLLLGIEPEPTSPRSVRLRFRDLRRGETVVTVLAPDL